MPAAGQVPGEQGHVENEEIVDRETQEVECTRIGAQRWTGEDENIHQVTDGA